MRICQPAEVPPEAEFIIRWGTTSNLPNRPVGQDKRTVINTAEAIHQTSNKKAFRLAMSKIGVAPKTWATLADLQREEEVSEHGVIVRPAHHERSENVYHCHTLADLKAAVAKCGNDYYISEYIPKAREIRVFVVSGKVIMAFEKQPKNKKDVSWGCVEEGALTYIPWSKWPLKAIENAIKAFNLSKLDFGAADVMIDDRGNAYVLEINTAPEVWPYYGERFAAAFQYIIKNGKDRLKVKDYTSWKDMMHPSLG